MRAQGVVAAPDMKKPSATGIARDMTVAMTANHWSAPEGRNARRDKAFRSARRHTLFVRFLRKAIPVAAVTAVIVLIVTPFLSPTSRLANVSVAAVGISNGKVRMETPRLSGYRKDNRPYEVTAENALQDIRNPTQVELITLRRQTCRWSARGR